MLSPMPSVAALSIDDYLAEYSDGHPPEYVDGRLVERPMTQFPHSTAQMNLSGIFYNLKKLHPIFPATEIHLRMPHNRVRIPDFAVFYPDKPLDDIPTIAPYLVAEIVSPHDSHSELMAKLEEYRGWGIRHIWVIDPAVRSLATYADAGLRRCERLTVPEFELSITPQDLFD